MREAASRVDLMSGTNYVVVALPGIVYASFEDIVGWLSDALESNLMKRKGMSS